MSQATSILSDKQSQAGTKPVNTPIIADILLFQNDTPAAANAFRYTEALASDCNGSHIIGLMFGLYPATAPVAYMDTAVDVWEKLRRERLEEATRFLDTLRTRFDRSGGSTEIRRVDLLDEEVSGVIARHSQYAAVTILGWPAGDDRYLEQDLLEGSLFYSGQPVLLIPQNWTIYGLPRTILIGWNGSREATRAVHDALPLLRKATNVKIVVVDDGSLAQTGQDPGADIALHLVREGVNVEVKQVASPGPHVSGCRA